MRQDVLPERTIGLFALSLLAIVVGLVTGVGAVAFRALIGLIHNVFYFGRLSALYDANALEPASPWGAGIILVPVIGGLAVTFLVSKFAPEARGHGVPEVMDAIFYREGRIRPVVAAVKSLASALSIGTGAAVGREGPIIQIGASLGSTLGQLTRMEAWQRITLVAAGAGAGIAATFNTPLGGVMFAVELMMPEVSVRTFLPVALATRAQPVSAPRRRHDARRAHDVRVSPRLRSLPHRWRWLFDHSGDPRRGPRRGTLPGVAVRRQTRRDLDQPRFRLLGRDFLALALHGGDHRRRFWRHRADLAATA
jgi:hypothetical protein